ncbi:MAG: hypothetical protein JKY90_00850 [Gammaproteobacteria bacterium]|nr:hypothetical protein [Gammaproteobacteria bacterium]
MHPLIRVVCLLLIAGFIASAHSVFLLITLCILAAVYILASLSLKQCWSLVRRMRWFFLSILIIYFWFTPGRAFSPELANTLWIPSVDGVEQGLIRVACLVLIIATVSALLQSTCKEQLFSAIYSLISWTRHLGLSPERFSVRVTLTLEALTATQSIISTTREQLAPSGQESTPQEHMESSPSTPSTRGANTSLGMLSHSLRARIAGLAKVTSGIFVKVYENAQQAELIDVELNKAEPISLWQWLYPLALVGLYIVSLGV